MIGKIEPFAVQAVCARFAMVSHSQWLRPRTTICALDVEDQFGPIVSELCASGFDFTWYFESVILALPVTVFFLVWALPRINYLRKENVKITGGYWGIVKLVRRLPLGGNTLLIALADCICPLGDHSGNSPRSMGIVLRKNNTCHDRHCYCYAGGLPSTRNSFSI